MRTTRQLLTALVLVSLSLSGCIGGGDEAEPSKAILDVRHSERSELTIAEVEKASDLTYRDLAILVDEKTFTFGSEPSFELRRFGVPGKLDAAETVEEGDAIHIPAAGLVTVVFRHATTGATLDEFEANVPDDSKPAAPVNLAPAKGETGVSKLPTFKWTPVKDVSGIRYQLQYGLDPTFSAPLQTVVVNDITAPNHEMRGGSELASGFTYHWHVRAVDGLGNVGPWSETWSFTVA